MTAFIFSLTLRQLLARKSTLLLLGLAALPPLLAVVFQIGQPEEDPERWTVPALYLGLVATVVLPLTALILGTSVLGEELEDGTAVYLLAKPLPRWQILAPKLAAAWLLTATLVVTSTAAAGLIVLGGGGSSIVIGFGVAMAAGALAYAAVFVLLSVVTSRALIAGLVYVFIWEGAITAIFEGTRYLSIRHQVLGIGDSLAGTPDAVYEAFLGGATAVVLLGLTVVVCVFWANRKLKELEVREPA